MFTLPKELAIPPFSELFDDHGCIDGGSSIIELMDNLRCGIIIAFCVMVGEESGDDCSASVE